MQNVQPPTQARSKQTLSNLLDAAERLLNEKSFLEISINEVVAEARSSVGSFYARFEDKNALLRHLSERFAAYAEQETTALLAAERPPTSAIFIEHVVERLIAIHHEKCGLIRALTLLPRVFRDDALRVDGMRMAGIFQDLARAIAEYGIPPEKISMGLFFAATAIREYVLFADNSKPLLDVPDAVFAGELSCALVAYFETKAQ